MHQTRMGRLQLAGPPETTGASGTLTLVSLAEQLAYLEKPSDSGGPFDVLIQMLIDSASVGAFAKMGGRFLKLPVDNFDFVFTPEIGGVIHLHQYPIATIALVEIGSMTADQVWSPVGAALGTNSYYADKRSGRLYGDWPTSLHSVRVRWTAGYSSVPVDAKEALMQWVGVKRSRQKQGRWDVLSIQGATEGYSFAGEIPASADAVFAKYALPEVSIA